MYNKNLFKNFIGQKYNMIEIYKFKKHIKLSVILKGR